MKILCHIREILYLPAGFGRVGAASSSYLPYLYISSHRFELLSRLEAYGRTKRGSARLEYKGCGPNEYLSAHLMIGLKAHLPEDKRGVFSLFFS